MRNLFFLAAAAAALSGTLGLAQTPATPAQGPAGAQPQYDQQLVTVEGCLQRGHASAEAALDVAADPQSRLVFLLGNAQVLSRTDTMAGSTGPAPEGGVPGPAGIQNERAGVRTEGATGTTGSGAGAAREGAGEPAPGASPTPAAATYVIVGLEDDRLRLFAGQRVALMGQFEPAAASVRRDAGGRGGEAQDRKTSPGGEPRRDEGEQSHQASDPQRAAAAGTAGSPLTLPQFRATSIKPVPGICPQKP